MSSPSTLSVEAIPRGETASSTSAGPGNGVAGADGGAVGSTSGAGDGTAGAGVAGAVAPGRGTDPWTAGRVKPSRCRTTPCPRAASAAKVTSSSVAAAAIRVSATAGNV